MNEPSASIRPLTTQGLKLELLEILQKDLKLNCLDKIYWKIDSVNCHLEYTLKILILKF